MAGVGWPRPAPSPCCAISLLPPLLVLMLLLTPTGAGQLAKTHLAGKIGGATVKCEQVRRRHTLSRRLGCCCRLMPALRGSAQHLRPIHPKDTETDDVSLSYILKHHSRGPPCCRCHPHTRRRTRIGMAVWWRCAGWAPPSHSTSTGTWWPQAWPWHTGRCRWSHLGCCCCRPLGSQWGSWRQSRVACKTRCLQRKLTPSTNPTAAGSTALTTCRLSRRHVPTSVACGKAPSRCPGNTAMVPPRLPRHQRPAAHRP